MSDDLTDFEREVVQALRESPCEYPDVAKKMQATVNFTGIERRAHRCDDYEIDLTVAVARR